MGSPRIHSAGHAGRLCITGITQDISSFRTAPSGTANNHYFPIFRNLIQSVGELSQRDQSCPIDMSRCPFAWFTYIHQKGAVLLQFWSLGGADFCRISLTGLRGTEDYKNQKDQSDSNAGIHDPLLIMIWGYFFIAGHVHLIHILDYSFGWFISD